MVAVAGLILGHHWHVVGQTALRVVHYAVKLICLADADVTFAALYGDAERRNVSWRLPGDVKNPRQTVEVVLYVLRHTRGLTEKAKTKHLSHLHGHSYDSASGVWVPEGDAELLVIGSKHFLGQNAFIETSSSKKNRCVQ